MKKSIKIILGLILIISLIIPIKNYSVLAKQTEKQIIEIKSNEELNSNTIEIVINLDQIIYDSFSFELFSNVSLENLETNEDIDIRNKNDNELSFKFNKNDSNIESLTLNYDIPDDLEVGDTIIFKAIITSESEEDVVIEIDSDYTIKEDGNKENKENQDLSENNTETNDTKQELKNEKENDNSNNNNKEEKTSSDKDASTTSNKKTSANQSQSNMKSSASNISTQTQKVRYNGSDNNYLSSLVVDNYSFNKDFKKEGLNYFISVDESVSSINVSAIAEDSNSKVYINGNTNLKSRINKVLVSVVAENGNVRNYRIYVEKA